MIQRHGRLLHREDGRDVSGPIFVTFPNNESFDPGEELAGAFSIPRGAELQDGQFYTFEAEDGTRLDVLLDSIAPAPVTGTPKGVILGRVETH
jgi:hypothetical protein